LSSASLTIAPAIAFADLAKPFLVEASLTQFQANIPPDGAQAGFAVPAAIAFAHFAQPFLIHAGAPQLFTVATAPRTVVATAIGRTILIDAETSWPDLKRLGEARNRHNEESRNCYDQGIRAHRTILLHRS